MGKMEKRANSKLRSRAPEAPVDAVPWTCTRVDLELPGVGGPAAGTGEAAEEKPPIVSADSTF